MAVMLQKTYEALRAAGAPEDKAEEAAVELAGFWKRLTRIEIITTSTLAILVAVAVRIFTM